MEQGMVHSVDIVTLGSYLAADAATSATSVVVESVLDFNQDGGVISLNGVEYTYTAADFDTDTLTIPAGLSADALTGDRVDVLPLSVEKNAKVVVAGSEDALTAVVPHALFDRVPEGIRDTDMESVTLELTQAGQFVITDIVGRQPVIDGSYIDPVTLPPATSDGDPPASSPTPTAIGGIGAVLLRWSPVVNNDPVTYAVYGDTTPGFTEGPGNLLVETMGSSLTHRPSSPDYAATYYYKIVAFDADGSAAVSGEASTQLVQVTTPDIAANYVYAGTFVFDQAIGGTLNADMLFASTISNRPDGTGPGTDIDQAGITIFDSAGAPGTVLQPDNSVFKGDAEVGGLTVKGGLALRSGGMHEISKGAVLTLQSATTAAQSPPSYVVGYPDPIVVAEFAGCYGLVRADVQWSTVADVNNGGVSEPVIRRTNDPDVTLPANSPRPWGGLAKIGTSWYTLGIHPTSFATYYITKYSSTGTAQAQVTYTPLAGVNGSGGSTWFGLAPASIGTDGTNLLVAEFDDANDRFRIQTRDPSTLAVTATLNTGTNAGFNGPVVGISSGSFDLGATRFIVLSKNGQHFWPFDTSGVYQPNEAWATPQPGSMSGFDWDATRFWSTRARHIAGNPWIYRHTTHKWSGADPLTWHATTTWRDTDATGGTHETDMGQTISFPMKKRAAVTLTSSTIPDSGGTDDPNAVSFYLSNTNTARTSFWRQTLPADGVNTLTVGDGITFSGTNPPAANDFPGATPASIENATGTLVIDGNGEITAESATLDGVAVPKIATGNFLFGAVTTLQTQAISFPFTFGAAPTVLATARTSADVVVHVAVSGESTTGFNLHFKRSPAVPTNVAWVAVGS